jgi:DNA-binding MarR family transcriptional regulator
MRGNALPMPLFFATQTSDMKTKRTRYLNIDLTTMDQDMTLKEKAVLSHIESLSKQRGYCYASNRAICETLSISDRSMYRILNKLEERGYLVRKTKYIGKNGRERRIYPSVTATVAV